MDECKASFYMRQTFMALLAQAKRDPQPRLVSSQIREMDVYHKQLTQFKNQIRLAQREIIKLQEQMPSSK